MPIRWLIPLMAAALYGPFSRLAIAAESPRPDAATVQYETWKREYGSRPPSYWFKDGDASLRLTVTAVEGDEPPARRGLEKYRIYGAQVSGDWRAAWFSQSERGTKSGGVAR